MTYFPSFSAVIDGGKAAVKIRNFTPHDLVVVGEDGEFVLRVESEGQIRLDERIVQTFKIGDLQFVEKEYAPARELPPAEKGVLICVSKMTMDALTHRVDLICPDTGPDSAIRNENGRIVAVKRLQFRSDIE